ncbi:unnamed protein product [Prorocentrum cordatum]|uniref:Mei2-like C-terminal RNA recognition motif domain-containing protein n=1 Tax=Prorocentrum cordatum TaxID=2364126 RepID=A0ABN9RF97_9DINO|nr:unnamed protein product [Polarella glacialis]
MDTHRSHQRVCCGSAQLPRSKLLDVVIEKDNEDGARIQGPRLVPMGGACLQSTSGLLRHELTASGARDFPSEFEHAISHATQSEWVDCAGYLISSHATAPPVCPQVTGRLSSILSLYAPLVVPEGYCRPQALGEVLFEQAEVNDADFSHYCTSLPDVDRVQDGAVCAATLNPASKLASETAKAGGGLHPDVTTVMFRHIPRWCSEWQVMREIDDAGFMGMYDFFYLPLGTRSKANRGFAFLNFCSPAIAQEFYAVFHGSELCSHPAGLAEHALAVLPADLQGFDRNAAHYLSSRAHMRGAAPAQNRPLFFKEASFARPCRRTWRASRRRAPALLRRRPAAACRGRRCAGRRRRPRLPRRARGSARTAAAPKRETAASAPGVASAGWREAVPSIWETVHLGDRTLGRRRSEVAQDWLRPAGRAGRFQVLGSGFCRAFAIVIFVIHAHRRVAISMRLDRVSF